MKHFAMEITRELKHFVVVEAENEKEAYEKIQQINEDFFNDPQFHQWATQYNINEVYDEMPKCKKCGQPLKKSEGGLYEFTCDNCDEDFSYYEITK